MRKVLTAYPWRIEYFRAVFLIMVPTNPAKVDIGTRRAHPRWDYDWRLYKSSRYWLLLVRVRVCNCHGKNTGSEKGTKDSDDPSELHAGE